MERYNKIYPKRKSAKMLASEFRKATGKEINPGFIHWLVKKINERNPQHPMYRKYPYGKEVYYAASLYTDLYRLYSVMYPKYKEELTQEKEKEEARKERIRVNYNPDEWIESNREPRFYDPVDEGTIKKYILEAIDELELFHGTPHDFDEFDLAYIK